MAFHELLGADHWPTQEEHDRIGAQIEAARKQEKPPRAQSKAPAISGQQEHVAGSLAAVFAASLLR